MEKDKIGYVYNLSVDLGSGRALTFSGNFAEQTDAHEMNAEIDKLLSVGARQQAKAMIPQIKDQIEVAERTIGAFEHDMLRLAEEGGGRNKVMNHEDLEKHNKLQAERTLEQHKAALESHKRHLAEAEAQAK